ncbi:SDR family oxidoreductase [soil metagenome]
MAVSSPTSKLAGHVAVVTGANAGIGAATAERLAADGASVLVAYLRLDSHGDPAAPDRYYDERRRSGTDVVDGIEATGVRAVALEADLADPAAPAHIFDHAEAELGPVDILVNNASGWAQDTFSASSVDHLGRAMAPVTAETIATNFDVDSRATALLIAELARRHTERGATWGRIVGLTSGGPMGFPSEVSYGAAKAAQENYTMAASVELAPLGITANIVYPPVTDTGWVTDDVRAFVAQSSDHHHVAEPAEVAEVIAWLCSEEARLVTGNVIRLR